MFQFRFPSKEENRDDTFQDPDDSGPRLSVNLKESSADGICALPASQAEQASGRCPDSGDQSEVPQSPPIAPAEVAGAPARPDLFDPVVLHTMPPKVAAFMLYEPPEPLPWRRQESEAEREAKEQCESDGA